MDNFLTAVELNDVYEQKSKISGDEAFLDKIRKGTKDPNMTVEQFEKLKGQPSIEDIIGDEDATSRAWASAIDDDDITDEELRIDGGLSPEQIKAFRARKAG